LAVLLAFASILPILIVMQPINGIVFGWDGVAIGAQRSWSWRGARFLQQSRRSASYSS